MGASWRAGEKVSAGAFGESERNRELRIILNARCSILDTFTFTFTFAIASSSVALLQEKATAVLQQALLNKQ